jgi:hypothetical protein
MCETLYQPGVPPEQRIEQLLHNASTWVDGLRIEQATGQVTPEAAALLVEASDWLEGVRSMALQALELQCAAARTTARSGGR